MNTWVIGNWPVGHQILNYPQPRPDPLAYSKPRKVLSDAPPNTSSSNDTTSPITSPPTIPTEDKPPTATLFGEKTFYMKARIMAGQANLTDSKLGLVDYKWLAKEEVQRVLDAREWNAVRGCLYER